MFFGEPKYLGIFIVRTLCLWKIFYDSFFFLAFGAGWLTLLCSRFLAMSRKMANSR